MNRTRTALAAAAASLLLTTGCTTYDDHVQACMKAVKARPAGDKTKPEACEPLKDDDYLLVVGGQAMDDLGWTDEEGNFDKEKFYRDAYSGQP